MRRQLKQRGTPRKKALFGADGAIMAAATLSAAGMNVAATLKSASTQAKALQESAKTQAEVIKDQTKNNTALQHESINFTKLENKENRDQQKEIQSELLNIVGLQTMNDRREAGKVALKYGGITKKLKTIEPLLYGGANRPFTVTDGGAAIPLQIDSNGYGLYELYGNDHEHYHKTPSGKYKSGVGIKFNNGIIVEGEGNQNTKEGEKFYVTPYDAIFISKNSIAGFNPAKAVDLGMHPEQAFAIQQQLKLINGINDDGSKMNFARRKKALNGLNLLNMLNQSNNPQFNTSNIAAGTAYAVNNLPQIDSNMLKCGGHRKLKSGGRIKAQGGFWQNHAGATYAGIGNLVGAGISAIGNAIAGNKLAKAYTNAGNILAEAYDQMHGIDLSELNREDYNPGHVMAVVRSSNTNINPQLERIRRNAETERRAVNNNTLSSAARQQRLAGLNDRMYQQMGEQYAYKDNADEKIRQENAARIQEASAENAKLDTQARQNYSNARMSLLQYNNNIENAKIAGRAQSLADSMTQSSLSKATGITGATSALGAGITGAAQGFANSISVQQKADRDYQNVLIGSDTESAVNAIILRNDKATAKKFYDNFINSDNPNNQEYARRLNNTFKFN